MTRYRPGTQELRCQHDGTISAHVLPSHVQLSLVALVAAERLERCMLLEDGGKALCVLDANIVVEEIGRHQCPLGVVL